MTLEYLLTRLAKINATITTISKYDLLITEANGSETHFPSRDAIYKHYFERKYGDEKKVGKKKPEYVRMSKLNY